jgi:alpha-D-ribose 1-methylphosphonate 5-triphosphate synthase subunit PhnL
MAFLTPVNGDAQPVFAIDVQNGPIAPATATAATPVNPAGPKLDFFRVVANTTVAGQQGVNGYVGNVIRAIQQTSTVAVYQVDATILSFGVFPTGAFANAATFLTAANITATGFQLDSCTSIGFKLAAS